MDGEIALVVGGKEMMQKYLFYGDSLQVVPCHVSNKTEEVLTEFENHRV